MPEPFDPTRLIEEALRYVNCVAPGKLPRPLRVTIAFEGEHVVGHIFVPVALTLAPPPAPDSTPAPAPAPAPRPAGAVLNEMERDILQAVGEAGGEQLTGEQIAERAGYPWDASLRQTLAGLRRRGILTGEHGARGYGVASPIPPTV